MYPDVLYLQREFCGVQPGAEFKLRSSHPSDKPEHVYSHVDADGGTFVIPAEAALGDPEWFGDEKPSAAPESDDPDELGAALG